MLGIRYWVSGIERLDGVGSVEGLFWGLWRRKAAGSGAALSCARSDQPGIGVLMLRLHRFMRRRVLILLRPGPRNFVRPGSACRTGLPVRPPLPPPPDAHSCK